jgi:antitoxin component YwqK of YwqJK toxin-antitoxin module
MSGVSSNQNFIDLEEWIKHQTGDNKRVSPPVIPTTRLPIMPLPVSHSSFMTPPPQPQNRTFQPLDPKQYNNPLYAERINFLPPSQFAPSSPLSLPPSLQQNTTTTTTTRTTATTTNTTTSTTSGISQPQQNPPEAANTRKRSRPTSSKRTKNQTTQETPRVAQQINNQPTSPITINEDDVLKPQKYRYDQQRMYIGFVKEGKKDGFGTFFIDGNKFYEGFWKNDLKHGEGTAFNEQGEISAQGTWIEGNLCDGTIMIKGHLAVCLISYEGEVKNFKRDGFGTSYLGDEKDYEGEWTNNARNGQGTTYWQGQKNYEGEWKDDKRNGYGRSSSEGHIDYDGEWKDDKKHGTGIAYDEKGEIIAEGNWVEGKLCDGTVTKCHYFSMFYEGGLKNFLQNGFGISFIGNEKVYEGMWKNGKRHGQGTSFLCSGEKDYVGEWKDGDRHGTGTAYDEKGEIIAEGNWVEGKLCDGTATKCHYFSKFYEGGVKNFLQNGFGISFNGNKKAYEGMWKDGKRHGQGTLYLWSGEKDYVGEWKDDKCNGYGTSYSLGHIDYQGEWKDGKKHGTGIAYDEKGEIIAEGNWEEGLCKGTIKNQEFYYYTVIIFHKYLKNG